jgi:hypothetical protein
MGTLIYGPAAKELEIDDRTLAHVQAVIIAKLRRGESFAFNWQKTVNEGSGHVTIWIHPGIYIEFLFFGSKHIQLGRKWVKELMMTANSVGGLKMVPEPAEDSAYVESP